MKSSYRLMFVMSGAFIFGVIAGNGMTLRDTVAQGYEGLIAPDNSGDPETEAQGYKGLIPGKLPKPQDTVRSGSFVRDSMNKYEGYLLANPESSVAARKPQERTKSRQVKSVVGRAAERYINNGEKAGINIKMPERNVFKSRPASIDSISVPEPDLMPADYKKGIDSMPEALKYEFSKLIPESQKREQRTSNTMRINGMLPGEYFNKKKIDQIMSFALDPNLTRAEHQENLEKAKDKLAMLESSMRDAATEPAEIYQVLGLPKSYVLEEYESATNVLLYAVAARKELEKQK